MKSIFFTCLFFVTQLIVASGTVKIATDKTSGCAPLQVKFTSSADNCKWDFGNGSKSDQKSASTYFMQPGNYVVKLTDATGNTDVVNVTVFSSPAADFKADNVKICAGNAVSFINTSNGNSPLVNYVWAFGDGKTMDGKNLANTSHLYKVAGQYDVSLLVTDVNGCTSSKTAYAFIDAKENPVSDFKPSVTGSCSETQNISFANQSTGAGFKLSYSWNFGDKQTSTEVNPSHLFAQGKHDVALTVTDENGCSNTSVKKVSVTKLKADFMTEKEQACSGEKIKFINTSNYKGEKCTWEFGDGTTSTESNPEKAFLKPGNYSVKLTIAEGECKETITKTDFVHVRNGINTSFSSDISNSCNQPVSVKLKNNTPNSAVVLWNFGDGTISTKNNPEKIYAEPGNYKVSLEVTDSSGCTVKKESEKVIHALKPMVRFTGDTFTCAGYQVKFTNFTPNAASYLWNFGDGETSTQKNPFHVYKQNGHYDVSLTAFGDGCDSTIVMKNFVHVNNLNVDFDMTATTQNLVPPFLYSFVNKTNAANVKYLWDFGDGTTEASINPIHIYNTPGNFNVRLVAYAKNGCTNSKMITNNIQMGTSSNE